MQHKDLPAVNRYIGHMAEEVEPIAYPPIPEEVQEFYRVTYNTHEDKGGHACTMDVFQHGEDKRSNRFNGSGKTPVEAAENAIERMMKWFKVKHAKTIEAKSENEELKAKLAAAERAAQEANDKAAKAEADAKKASEKAAKAEDKKADAKKAEDNKQQASQPESEAPKVSAKADGK